MIKRGYIKDKSTITIYVEYNTSFIKDVEKIDGRFFNSKDKSWIIPISIYNITDIKVLLNSYNLTHLEKENVGELIPLLDKHKETSIKLAKSKIFDKFSLIPRKYQIEGISVLKNVDSVICGDDIGIGKTAQALLAIEIDNLFPCFVVCPSSVRKGWFRQWREWNPERSIEIIEAGNTPTFKSDVTVVSYDLLGRRGHKSTPRYDQFLKKKWKSVIFDESHFLKNSTSQRSKIAKKIAKPIKKKIMLSGNVITNRPVELYSQLSILGSFDSIFNNYRSYVIRYCNAKQTRFGLDVSGASNTDELYNILSSSCYYHRDKEDVLGDLPELQSHIIDIDIDNLKEYKSAETDLITYIKNEYGIKKAEKAFQAEHLVLLNTLRQLSQKGKIKGVTEWLEENIDQLGKVVVFGIFTYGLEELYTHFKDQSVIVYGKTKDKQYEIDRFIENDKIRFFFGNIESMGTGVDGLQKVCSNCCYIDTPLVPSKMDQATGRLWRSGQKNFVNEFLFLDQSTIDGRIYIEILSAKRSITDSVNKGIRIESSDDILKKLINSYC